MAKANRCLKELEEVRNYDLKGINLWNLVSKNKIHELINVKEHKESIFTI